MNWDEELGWEEGADLMGRYLPLWLETFLATMREEAEVEDLTLARGMAMVIIE